jgi:hypothetical protein
MLSALGIEKPQVIENLRRATLQILGLLQVGFGSSQIAPCCEKGA